METQNLPEEADFLAQNAQYEFTLSTIIGKRGSIIAFCTLHQGTFTDEGFDQILVEENRREFRPETEQATDFSDEIVKWIMNFDRHPMIRICTGKQMNHMMKPQYQSSIDVNLKDVNTPQRKAFLEQIIRFMLKDSGPGACWLTRRNSYDESKVRAVLPIQDRRSNVPLPF
jgi:hypothetical protein